MINKSFITLLILLSSVFVASAQKTTVFSEANLSYKRGVVFFEQGLYGQARSEFEQTIDLTRPQNEPEWKSLKKEAELYFAKASVRLNHPDGEKLILDFVREHQPDPVASQALVEVSNYYYNAKEYDKALEFLDRIDPFDLPQSKRSEVQFKKGYAYFVNKKFSPAKAAFKTIKDIENEYYYPTNYYYGMTAFFENDYKEAINSFQKAGKSKKYKSHIPYYVCQIYFAEGQFEELINYAVPLADDPKVRKKKEIQQLIGQAYFEKKDYVSALPYLEYYAERTRRLREEEFYQLGFTQYQTGHFDTAAKNFEQLSGVSTPLGQMALYSLGDCHIKLNQKATARNAFGAASRMNFDKSIQEEALFQYAKLSYELNADRDAISALQTISTDSKHYAEAQQIMSQVFLNTRDYEKAISIIEKMPNKTPQIRETYQKVTYLRGVQLYNNGDTEAAKRYFNKSQEVPIDATTKALATFWIGEIYHNKKEYGKSIQQFNQFLTISKTVDNLPDEASPYTANYTQGYNYLKQEKYTSALGYFQDVVADVKRNKSNIKSDYVKKQVLADATLRAGDCLFKRNKYRDALKFYEESIKNRTKGFVYALYQKAMIEGLRGKTVDKLLALEDITEKYPNSEYTDEAYLQLGITYQEIGKLNKAVPPLKKLIKNYKGKSDLINQALLRLGLISYNQGKPEVALNYYKQVFSNNPDAKEANDAMVAIKEIYVNDLGKPDEYLAFVESVPGYNVDDADKDNLNFQAAETQYENGNYDRAIQGFTNYLSRYPNGRNSLAAYYQRGESYSVLKKYSLGLNDYEKVVNKGNSKYYLKALSKAAIISYNHEENFNKAYRFYIDWEKATTNDEERFEAQLGALRSAYRIGKSANDINKLAQKVIKNSKATNTQKASANFYLGKSAFDQKNYDKARNAFNKVTKLSDNEQTAEARYLIAYIHYLKRDLDLAQKLCIDANKQSSNYPYWVAKSVILLADIFAEKGDIFSAKATLEGLLNNYNEDPDLVKIARQKLKQLEAQESTSSRLAAPRLKADNNQLELEEDNTEEDTSKGERPKKKRKKRKKKNN